MLWVKVLNRRDRAYENISGHSDQHQGLKIG